MLSVNQMPEDERLEQALACLSGITVNWLRYAQDSEVIKDWKDFKENLKKRFKSSRACSIVEKLLHITQKGSVVEHREQFEELSVELPHVPIDVIESMFLRGLERVSGSSF